MADQFGRQLKIILYPNSSSKEALDLSQFRVTFETQVDDSEYPNRANIRIFNLARELTFEVVNGEYSYIQIDAGYENNIGTIFLGTVRYARSGRNDRSDTYIDILAFDWDLFYGSAITSFSNASGSIPKDLFDSVISNSKIPPAQDNTQKALEAQKILGQQAQDAITYYDQKQLDNLPSNTYTRGKVCYGMARDCLRQLASSYGFNWSIQQGKLQLIPKQGVINVINIIDNTTGLIGFPEIHIDGIHLKTLLNPRVIVGSVIQLDNAYINGRAPGASASLTSGAKNDAITPTVDGAGKYRVIQVTYNGDTRGQNWYSDLICLSLSNFNQSLGGIANNQALLRRVGGFTGNYQNNTTGAQ